MRWVKTACSHAGLEADDVADAELSGLDGLGVDRGAERDRRLHRRAADDEGRAAGDRGQDAGEDHDREHAHDEQQQQDVEGPARGSRHDGDERHGELHGKVTGRGAAGLQG